MSYQQIVYIDPDQKRPKNDSYTMAISSLIYLSDQKNILAHIFKTARTGRYSIA